MAQKQHNTYMPGYGQVSHHEWRTAENSAAYLLPKLQDIASSTPYLKLLDVGAGSGTITASLAKYTPSGTITATDLSDEILQEAADYAKRQGVSNIRFEQANIYELSKQYGSESFDVVHSHQVLCHLDDPVSALSEMLKVTKSGGVVAVRESDLRMWNCYPDFPEIEASHKLQIAVHEASGGSSTVGPQLVSFAMKAGAKREQITATMGAWCHSTPEDRKMWSGALAVRLRNGEMRKKAVSIGVSTEAEMDAMADAWEKWAATEDACFGSMHGEVLVEK